MQSSADNPDLSELQSGIETSLSESALLVWILTAEFASQANSFPLSEFFLSCVLELFPEEPLRGSGVGLMKYVNQYACSIDVRIIVGY